MLYFDTSFIVPLILSETTSKAVESFFVRTRTKPLAVGQWTQVEFASALGRLVRTRSIDPAIAEEASGQFAAVVAESFLVLLPTPEDFDLSIDYLRHFRLGLRAGDALHLAVATNHRAEAFYSLDAKLVQAGKKLGLPVKAGIRSR